ncbi:MAG: sugar ABC transporter permease [Trueperaceae bacterium]|nr:sugar ABC transporter permease [Trueperaceae bacterium]
MAVSVPTRTERQTRPRGGALQRRETLAAYGFLLPNLVGFLIFTLLPVIAALFISLTDWNLLQPPKWVGLKNFVTLAQDPLFRKVLGNTAVYVLGTVPVQMILALLVAMALNQGLPGTLFFRAAFFMPVVTSAVAIALVWRWIYNADFGVLNSFLFMLGVSDPPQWLTSTRWALPSVMIMSVWQQIGFSMVLFLAGLQGVPEHLYEAARIDGAGPFQRFLFITVPMLTPTTFFVFVINIINSFQVFDQAFIMTGGGPANATNTIVYNIYQNAFQFFKMGYAAAMAWVLFAIIFVVTVVQFRLQSRWVHYE